MLMRLCCSDPLDCCINCRIYLDLRMFDRIGCWIIVHHIRLGWIKAWWYSALWWWNVHCASVHCALWCAVHCALCTVVHCGALCTVQRRARRQWPKCSAQPAGSIPPHMLLNLMQGTPLKGGIKKMWVEVSGKSEISPLCQLFLENIPKTCCTVQLLTFKVISAIQYTEQNLVAMKKQSL